MSRRAELSISTRTSLLALGATLLIAAPARAQEERPQDNPPGVPEVERPAPRPEEQAAPGQLPAPPPIAPAPESPPGEADEIVVTGIRSSLANALTAKRDSAQVLDAISAEDIGKFPDKNIGEALQRVTGVQLTRTNGEGSGVTIRGADPNLNRVEINGVTALSTTAGQRDVDFRDLPVEFVNRLEVVKSVTPDMTEGGLGGTVRVITRRPFDSREPYYIAGSAQTIYSELGGTFDPKFAAIGSTKLLDDTVGILLSGTFERRRVQSHEARTTGWRQIDSLPAAGLQPLDLDGNGNGDFFPDIPRYVINRLDTTRYALNGVIEWRPNDYFHTYLLGNYAAGEQDLNSQFLQITTIGSTLDSANTTVGPDDTVTHVEFVDNPAATTGNRLQAAFRNILGSIDRKTYNASLGSEYDRDQLVVRTLISYTRAKIDNNYIQPTADAIGLSRVIIDYSNPQQAPNIQLPIDPTNPAAINRVTVQHRPIINVQDEVSSKLDVEYRDLTNFLTSVKVGAQVRRLTADSEVYNATRQIDAFTNPALLPQVQQYASLMEVGDTQFFDTGDLGFRGPRGWLNATQEFAEAIGIPDPFGTPTLLDTWEVREKNYAGYGQVGFLFDFGGIELSGIAGARVVRTDTLSSGFRLAAGVATPVQFEGESTEFLPAVNLRADLIPSTLVARATATEVIARPTPQQLAPRFSTDIVGLTGSRGNPELEPFRARQYDFALEYYVNRTSFVSSTYFRKEISSFIQNTTQPEVIEGVTYTITLPVNGTQEVTINGLELGAQVALDFLPGPVLDKFGIIANYTYSKDSGYEGRDLFTGDALPFPGLSRHSYNVSGYYEDEVFSVRASYNWRSRYLITPVGRGNNPEFGEAFGQMEASVNLNLSDQFSVFLEAVNLLDATRAENANSIYRRTLLETYGRRLYAGARVRF